MSHPTTEIPTASNAAHYWLETRCRTCLLEHPHETPRLVGFVYVNTTENRWKLLRGRHRRLPMRDGSRQFIHTRSLLVGDLLASGGRPYAEVKSRQQFYEIADSDGTGDEFSFRCASRHLVRLTRKQIDTVVPYSIEGTLSDETIWARPSRRRRLNGMRRSPGR